MTQLREKLCWKQTAKWFFWKVAKVHESFGDAAESEFEWPFFELWGSKIRSYVAEALMLWTGRDGTVKRSGMKLVWHVEHKRVTDDVSMNFSGEQ